MKYILTLGLIILSNTVLAEPFHNVKSVGTSTYTITDFATKLNGLSVVTVKAKGKTYTDTYRYVVDCDGDNNIIGIKYAGDENYTTNLVKGSSMYNIAKSTCWMNYLAVSEINYTDYIIAENS